MKKAVIYISLLASMLLMLFMLEKAYDFFITKNLNIKAAYVQLRHINANILFHGPCEPNWMLSPGTIDSITHKKSYNLALNHSDFGDNYLHLYLYLKNNPAPEYIFLYVTPESFDERYNTFHTYRFAPYLKDEKVNEVIKDYDPSYYTWHYIPFMKYAYYSGNVNFEALQGMKHFYQKKSLPYFPDGYEPPVNRVWDNHQPGFLRLYPEGIRFRWSERREKYLRKITHLCNENNIRLTLYESPVLREAIPFQLNRNEFIDKIKRLAKQEEIPYYVFDTLAMARSKKYFISILNTTVEGSQMFSRIFGKYIRDHVLSADSLPAFPADVLSSGKSSTEKQGSGKHQ